MSEAIMAGIPRSVELLVVGGGPAGLGAATEAARRGVDTLVVDENERAGGQLYKQIHKFFGSAEHYAGTRGFRIAEVLIAEAEALGVRILPGFRAVGLLRDGRIAVEGPKRAYAVYAERVVLAAGGRENSLPFPGSTLPGIMSAGAAQTLCNVHRVLPGGRVAMVGSGNVGLIVAYQLMQAGAELAGLIELRNKIGGYYVHAGKLRRAGVPFYLGHRVVKAEGEGRIESVTVESLSTGEHTQLSVDGLYLSVGLTPRQELGRMFGCELSGESLLGGAFPLHDHRMRTSVQRVYVAGDAAGIEEANSSLDEGRLAGISVAEDLGKIDSERGREESETISTRLEELRSGSHGEGRLRAKERVASEAAARAGRNAGSFAAPRESGSRVPVSGEPVPREAASRQPAAREQVSRVPVFRKPGPQESGSREPEGSNPPAVPCGKDILEKAGKAGHALPLIDCPETIPCNPCVDVCPAGAISMEGICGLPEVDYELCTGCMRCAAACPGQAIFMVGLGPARDSDAALVTVPWEYLPHPAQGDSVELYGRDGAPLGLGTVTASRMPRTYDRTRLVTLEAPREAAVEVQHCAVREGDR